MKKVLALILTLALMLGMTAFGSAEGEPVTLTAVVTSDPGSLYPYGIPTGGKTAVRNQVYEPLFWPDENGELQGIVGKSYTTDGNGVYDIEIYDYVKDSDGNPLTAADVVFSYDMLKEDGKLISMVRGLKSYEATGDYTLRFTFENEKIGDFSRTVSNCYLVTKAAWEANGQMVDNPVGTGLYKLVSHISGSEYKMVKRDDYWQTDDSAKCIRQIAKVDEITLRIISDPSTIAAALENGEIDYTQNIVQADRVNYVDADGNVKDGYVMQEAENYGFVRLTFNSGENGISDLYLRQAICTAIDNAAICFNNEGNFGHVCEAPINANMIDADAALNNPENYYNYDVDAAKELLAKSGYNGETIDMLINPNERTKNAGILITAYCKQIGVNINPIVYEQAQFDNSKIDTTGTEWDILLDGLNSNETYYVNVVTEYDKANYSTGLNGMYIDDAKLQELYDISASPSTNSKETTNDLVQYVFENCYSYGLYYYNVYWFGRDCVKEIVVDKALGLSMYNAFVIER